MDLHVVYLPQASGIVKHWYVLLKHIQKKCLSLSFSPPLGPHNMYLRTMPEIVMF